jgi:phage terminase large subunit-like protein
MASAPSIASADREAVRRAGFPAFVELAGRHVPKIQHFVKGRHQRVLAEHYGALIAGECEILLCNVPPGHMKSTIASVMGPAWLWSQNPAYPILCASHSDNLVNDLADLTKGLVTSRWYVDRWGDTIVDGGAKKYITTFAGGYRLAGTVRGGSLIGRHGALFTVDDPLDPNANDSVAGKNLENAKSWLRQKVLTRGKIGYPLKVCLVMQRLHEEDPSGFLINSFKDEPYFRHVNLPYLYEADHRHGTKYDWRTINGEELWPEAKKRAEMQRLAKGSGGELGEVFRAHAQQDPSSGSDRIFSAEHFGDFAGAPRPEDCILVLSVDPTFTGKRTSDDVALEIWGYYNGHFYCFFSEHSKRGFASTVEQIKILRKTWKPHYVLVEEAANGAAIVETLKPTMPGILAIPVAGGPSKANRARAASHHFTAGAVHFDKNAEWYPEKARLLLRFTGLAGGVDDTVDTTSQAILWLAAECGSMAGFDEAMAEMGPELRAAGFGLDLGLS